jgi:hypothetical protein
MNFTKRSNFNVSYFDSNGVKQIEKNVPAKNAGEAIRIVRQVKSGTNFFAV